MAWVALAGFSSFTGLPASEVPRNYMEVTGPDEGMVLPLRDRRAGFELQFKVDGPPRVTEAARGGARAWIFQYSLENRRGVEVQADRLAPGDLLLDPLSTPVEPPAHASGVKLKERGEEISEKDVLYLKAKSFRSYYDRSGTPIMHNVFKVGDVLELYKRVFDSNNQVVYEESGLQRSDDITIIENGTTLTEKHIAMLAHKPVLPARVRAPVELNLEFYLRVDWPDMEPLHPNRFWVKREGAKGALYLLPYELSEGDVPVGNVIQADGTVICQAGKPLTKTGALNSIEVLNKQSAALMVDTVRNKSILALDPITGIPDVDMAEPGDLVLAPQNRGVHVQPILLRSKEDEKTQLNPEKYSYALPASRKEIPDERYRYPAWVHYTHYPIPVTRDCIAGCDELLKIEKDLMTGQHTCAKCKRTLHFDPWVYQPMEDYPYLDKAWLRHPVTCGVCRNEFMPWQGHDRTDEAGEAPEIPPQEQHLLPPPRLRPQRFKAGSALIEDAFYYKNGEKVVVPKGTVIDEDLRKQLEQRPISPVPAKEKTEGERTIEMVQCPVCFAWNAKPLPPYLMTGLVGVDEVRRGMVAFPHLAKHINKLELVVFGLSSEREPTSNRDKALLITFRRVGDEHFQDLVAWEVTAERWKFLPRYAHEDGTRQPDPVFGEAAAAKPAEQLLE